MLELALGALAGASMPEPSLTISSGRGLYLLWLHSPIPRAALPRWTACQRALWEVLKLLDAARVLRAVGTVHGRAGATVETVTPAGEARPFEELADRMPDPTVQDRTEAMRHTGAAASQSVQESV